MTKYNTLLFLILFTAGGIAAQKPYFQQEVQYTLRVALDDAKHTLTGDVSFEYINNSPDQLTELWIHLWPNAFKNRNTAFCRQQLRQGGGKFYFAPDSTLGYIKGLDFTVNGQKVTLEIQKDNPDIARLILPSPLLSGGHVTVATPFVEKIPDSYSRLGHVGTSYQMTQWFPKPAVYDRDGWHAMPNLNQGEFYSEFGSFDVTITLPSNYVVGATGALQNPEEVAFLNQKVRYTQREIAVWEVKESEKTATKKGKRSGNKPADKAALDPFPASATTMKTIRYKADRVHDFAWFADKRYYVLKDTAILDNGQQVDCWAMFNKSDIKHWKKGAFYVKRATEFYSKHIGNYPYPHATAVHSALSAGAGMEYPMITVIGDASSAKSLDEVIMHEVGHNWFYGMLASNERDHPWMDEGMNSYYEQRYMRTYYNGGSMEDQLPKKIYDPKQYGGLLEVGLLMLIRNGFDQTADQNSDRMTSIAYALQSYMKTAHCMRWLEESVGTEIFDRAMQDYFRRWSFKHPQPEDFEASMMESGMNVDWFMQTMRTRGKSNPALKQAKKQADGTWDIAVQQRGSIKAPYAVAAMKDGQVIESKWVDPTATSVQLKAADADHFEIDPEHLTLDAYRKNNALRAKGLLPGLERLKIACIAPIQRPNRTTLGAMPWIGYNGYDGLMAGLLLYNPPAPGNRLQYYLAPGFGFNSTRIVGGGDVRYRIHPEQGGIKRVTIGLQGRSFNDNLVGVEKDCFTRFYRVTPSVTFDFNTSNTAVRHSIRLRMNFIGKEICEFDTARVLIGTSFIRNQIPEIRYDWSNATLPNPFSFGLALEGQQWGDNNYMRSTVEWKQQFYFMPKRKISLRLFGGYFVQNTNRNRKALGFGAEDAFARGSLSLAQNGYTDYKYDYIYMDRNGSEGLLSRQVNLAEGGFKYAFPGAYALSAGHSNSLIASLNLMADLPKKLPFGLPIKPYFDLGYADLGFVAAGGEEPSPLFWSGGFAFDFFKGNLQIFFPAINSKNINDLYKETSKGNYLRRVTWSVRLHNLDPLDVADKLIK